MKALPALLNFTIEDFDRQIKELTPHFDHFSIDIQDGKFVTTKTVDTAQVLEYFSQNPIDKNIIFDFDLMTYNYEKSIEDIHQMQKYITVGSIILHKALLNNQPIPAKHNFTIGIALNAPDQVEELANQYNLNEISCIQIMTIYAGPQGQPFIPESLKKIGVLRKMNYRNNIFIDGAVNDQSMPIIKSEEFKPDFICVGSFLSKAGDKLEDRIKYLKSIEE